jgi:hypothetical protein
MCLLYLFIGSAGAPAPITQKIINKKGQCPLIIGVPNGQCPLIIGVPNGQCPLIIGVPNGQYPLIIGVPKGHRPLNDTPIIVIKWRKKNIR